MPEEKMLEWLRADIDKLFELVRELSKTTQKQAALQHEYDLHLRDHLAAHVRKSDRWWRVGLRLLGQAITAIGAVLLTFVAAGKWPW